MVAAALGRDGHHRVEIAAYVDETEISELDLPRAIAPTPPTSASRSSPCGEQSCHLEAVCRSASLGARDRHDIVTFVKQPSERDLPWLHALARGGIKYDPRCLQVGVVVLTLVARIDPPRIPYPARAGPG